MLKPLVLEFQSIFAPPGLIPERSIQHKIDLIDSILKPYRNRQYGLSPDQIVACNQEIQRLLDNNWISSSNSPCNAPLLLIRTKKYSKIRVVISYRLLNKNTVLDRFPLPCIYDFLDYLNKVITFSKVDLTNAYHQVEIALKINSKLNLSPKEACLSGKSFHQVFSMLLIH